MQDAAPRNAPPASLDTPDMRAVVVDRYGPPEIVRVTRVEGPKIGPADVLVRVHAASVCTGDVHLLTGKPYLVRLAGYGLLRPRHRIPGQNISGEVVAIGAAVRDFAPGDQVYGEIPHGAFAEYAVASAHLLAPKPANLSHEEAAAVPGSAMAALQGLRDVGRIEPGQKVLINGASGGVGTYAVQIAKSMGAEVTAVCSTRHAALVSALGADRVIDYTKADFTRCGELHDIMLDLVCNQSLTDCKRILKQRGVLAEGAVKGNWFGPLIWMVKIALANAVSSQRITLFMARPNRDDLLVLKQMIEAGRVRPVIEKRLPLEEAATALSHVGGGHAQGTTVITMAGCAA